MKQNETIDLERLSEDGKTYYAFSLYIPTGEILRFKNYGCTARAEKVLFEKYPLRQFDYYKYIKFFHNGTNPEIDLNNIYKKYHKFFKDVA